MKKDYKLWNYFYKIVGSYFLLNIISCISVYIATMDTTFVGKYSEESSWDIIELNSTYYSIGLLILAIGFTLIYLKMIKPNLIKIFKSEDGIVKLVTGVSVLVFAFINATAAYFTEIVCTGLFSTYNYPISIYFFFTYILGLLIIDYTITKRKNEKVI